VNDCAERGRKLASDFAVTAKDAAHSIMLCKLLKNTENIIPIFEERE